MMQKSLASALLGSFLLLLSVSSAVAQTCPAPPATMFPPAPAAFTHTAVADGGWNATATWGGAAPGNGAVVCIPAGRSVTITRQETARVRFVQVNGELKMKIAASTRLYVDTIYVETGGAFTIGLPNNPVVSTETAELVFISWDGNPINRSWDPEEKSRGLVAMGSVKVYGDPKDHMIPMTADALKTATHLTVDSVPVNWKVGDSIVLTGSYFRRLANNTPEPAASSQDERVTITAISGGGIDFTPALAYDHVRPRSDLRLHVADLTRNLIFRSESTSTPLRGHVMLMNRDVDIRHAAFVNLGRTDKSVPLDDFLVQCITSAGPHTCDGSAGETDYSIAPRAASAVTNRRGRYALHFHLNGTLPGSAPPSKVYNSVVDGTTGWAFVNHGSHVDFQNDVAYNFTGAGFIAEQGDELGNYDNNIAIRGTGNGEYRPLQVVFQNFDRPQPLGDFAFSGDGFWFQGPAVRARNNVASGCDGVGMIWFTTGTPDVTNRFTENGYQHDRYTSFPRSAVSTVYAGFSDLASFLPRYWDHSATNEKLVITDLPILECDGFEGYGNLVGFRLRFNNFTNISWYGENPYSYDNHIVAVGANKAYAARMRQAVKNLKLWNNEKGTLPNYTSLTDWSNVDIVNRLDYDANSSYVGAELNRQIDDSTFTNLTIDGYEVPGWIENNGTLQDRDQITFLGTQSYLHYVNFDTWNTTLSCALPAGVTVTNVSATSRKISWSSNPAQKRYMVRYRANGDQQWKLVDTTGTSVTLTGLATGKTYTYQVVAGCKDTTTGKETAPSKYTTAATFNT